ncbi:MAG: TIGR03067 domain-containing protein [Candidatus Synoicihabitans palmerolidicus]|nr:TIGR03067 domain-containing protein [Candidatus Synoicihabitans palmerolidicus]
MVPEALKSYEGEWVAVSGRLGASTIPLPDTTFTIAAERYVVVSAHGQDEGHLKWGPVAKPQAVDLVGTGGAHAGKTINAIARVTEDMMQLCYAVDGGGRPRGFDVVSGIPLVTVRYRRIRAGGPDRNGN